MGESGAAARQSAFSIWLRTGRVPRREAGAVELKYNPWHDPQDGRFTFANTGRHYGGSGSGGDEDDGAGRSRGPRPGGASRRSTESVQAGPTATQKEPALQKKPSGGGWMDGGFIGGGGGSGGGGGASGTWGAERAAKPAPAPANARVGGFRGGVVAPSPVAREPRASPRRDQGPRPNIITAKAPASRPPAPAQAEPLRTVTKNGYTFRIDARGRTRRVSGEITLSASPIRSRSAQANAGKPDRHDGDEGGHYIAARFNGPTEAFNHFAQNSNFNRGDYRKLENQWARAKQEGKRVTVTIVPRYESRSIRPEAIDIAFKIDGRKERITLPNTRSEKRRGK